MMGRTLGVLLAGVIVCLPIAGRAEEGATEPTTDTEPTTEAPAEKRETAQSTAPGEARLEELVVEAKRPESAASSEEIPAKDLQLRPHDTPFQMLTNLPGVVVAQHQGGNKAPQYLVRGFDADHGTDFAVFLDSRPVNLPTHGHGQGYADVNMVIPETVERLQLYKGPYFVQFGDFENAGALNFVTREEFKENFITAEGGYFNTQRYAIGASPRLGPVKTLLAAQYFFTDGPFENPDDNTRYNLFTKFTLEPHPNAKLWLSATVYDGTWHGSGQIPLRAVSDGTISRFGSIDPTEGGSTDQEDLDLHYDWKPTDRDVLESQLYGFRYKLDLNSDFTFFKDTGLRFVQDLQGIHDTRDTGPPIPGAHYVPGDGIEQNDQRYVYGGKGRYTHSWFLSFLNDLPVASVFGFESRNDDIHVALHRQVQRNRFFTVNELSVAESSLSPYFLQQIFFRDWIRFEFGLRTDVFFLNGKNRLPVQGRDPNFTPVAIRGNTSDHIFNPKANLIVTPLPETDVYLNFGEGYHSNDARNALLAKAAGSDFSPLTRSLGYELGTRTRQFDRLDAAAALWLLDLDSELVFSGDAGNQEMGAGGNFVPAGPTRRWGVDFESRYQILKYLYADYDISYADPRFTNGDAIPLAPTLLMNGGITFEHPTGFSAALRTRFLDDRPATEDRTLTARGYTLLDLLLRYRWKNVQATLNFYNLTDTDWREAQFSDNSCLRSEIGRVPGCLARPGKQGTHADPAPDIHFTPGNPFSIIGGLTVFF